MEGGERSIVECLELQRTEVEMLSSMYPKKEEFSITVPSIVSDIDAFVNGKLKRLPNNLDYTLHLEVPDVQEKLEVKVNLPHKYPDVEPVVYVRSAEFSREQQKRLNDAVSSFLSSQCKGELCISQLLSWLTENAVLYFSPKPEKKELRQTDAKAAKEKFRRIWIYSHHIFNKDKRRAIVEIGENLGLAGFSLPGKPGIICVEGWSRDCESFYQRIRQMNWKKLSLVKDESFDLTSSGLDSVKCFEPFKEISFQVRRGPAREYHMDMGGFYKYLDAHNCEDVFQDIFGFEGHTASEDK